MSTKMQAWYGPARLQHGNIPQDGCLLNQDMSNCA
jgi:hypothetical protein